MNYFQSIDKKLRTVPFRVRPARLNIRSFGTCSQPSPNSESNFFPVNDLFREYLHTFHRSLDLPVSYEDLLKYDDSFPLINKEGNDTLWQTLIYEQQFGRDDLRRT